MELESVEFRNHSNASTLAHSFYLHDEVSFLIGGHDGYSSKLKLGGMGLSFCSPAAFISISRSCKSGRDGISVTLDVPKRRGNKRSKDFAAFSGQTNQMTSVPGLKAELPKGANTGGYKCES